MKNVTILIQTVESLTLNSFSFQINSNEILSVKDTLRKYAKTVFELKRIVNLSLILSLIITTSSFLRRCTKIRY